MIAKKVFERLDFERGIDPKKSMKIGQNRFIIPPSEINFESRGGQGYVGDNISVTALGWTTKAGRKILTISDQIAPELLPDIVEFLNTPKMKLKAAQILQRLSGENPHWFKMKK